jgi:hypothetical protein
VNHTASGGLRLAKSRRNLIVCAVAVLAVVSAFTAAASSSAGKQPSLSKSPVSGGVIFAQAVHAGDITPDTGSGPSNPSSAPVILTNVQASGGTQPVNEVPITADPNNALHLLSGGNDYNCGTLQGFFTSGDGGGTWAHHCLRSVAGLLGFGDPAVAYDTAGNAYAAGIDANSSALNGRIVFEKSTNNGATWSLPATAVTALFPGGLTDKEWMEIDHGATSAHPGAIYISVTQFDSSFAKIAISVSHSFDGGATWSRVQVGPTVSGTTVDQFSDLAVGSDGTVYLSWMRCSATGPTGDCGGSTASMLFSKSTNGGVTWSAPVTMVSGVQMVPDTCGAFYGCVPGTSERVSNIPVIDVDQATGALYVVYDHWTGTNMQARVVKSTNGGATWGAPVAIVPAATRDQFFPWLSVASDGRVGTTMLVRNGGTRYTANSAISSDGGLTYPTKSKLSTFTSNTLNDGFGGSFMGDYTGNIWTGGTLHMSWPDTRTGVSADETGGVIP